LEAVGLWAELLSQPEIHILPPLGYWDFLAHLLACSAVITDSSTVMKEAYYAAKPTVVLDETTEYTDMIAEGMTVIAGRRPADMAGAMELAKKGRNGSRREIFGDGKAAEKIAGILRRFSESRRMLFPSARPS
jgi:UDP-N-acetylglucosamine 2-epimerase